MRPFWCMKGIAHSQEVILIIDTGNKLLVMGGGKTDEE